MIVINPYYVLLDNNIIRIGNNFLELAFDSTTGFIKNIVNKVSNTRYVFNSGPLFYLWILLCDERGLKSMPYALYGESYRVYSPYRLKSFKYIYGEKTVKLLLNYILKSRIYVQISFKLGLDELVYSTIHVKNMLDDMKYGQIVAVGFPQIYGLKIGEDYRDDILVRPNRFGEKIVNPVDRDGTYHKNLCYGGLASMQWMDLYDESGGIYLASYDKTLLLTDLETDVMNESKTLRLGIRKYPYIPPRSEWISQPYVIGIHCEDWHWAADKYREWCNSWMRKPRIPDWLKDFDGWYGLGFHRLFRNNIGFKDIPMLFEEARRIGFNHIQFWGQMVGDTCCYRFYYPNPFLGSIDEFKDGIRYVRERGGHIGFYYNIQAFDPTLPNLPSEYLNKIPKDIPIPDWREFRNYAQRQFDGSYVVQYPNEEIHDGYRIMCLCSRGWRKYLKYWIIEKYLKEYGVNAAYIDQVFSPPVTYCFNFKHGHRHHGDTVRCRVSFIKEIVEEATRIDPDFIIAIEGNGDAIGQYAHLHLYTSFSTQTRYPCPEVFSYTFPDYIIIDGFANPWSQQAMQNYYPDIKREWSEKDVLNRVYLLGYRFDITLYDRLGLEEEFTKYLMDVVKLRKRIKKYQYDSRFIDDMGVVDKPRHVEVKLFINRSRKFLLINYLDNRSIPENFDIKLDLGKIGIDRIVNAKIFSLNYEGDVEIIDDDMIKVPDTGSRIGSIICTFR